MSESILYDQLKLRLRRHRIHFRKPLPLRKFEKAILGILSNANSCLGYVELGQILGFAVQSDSRIGLRKDSGEIEMYETFLNEINNSHLLKFDHETVCLTDWGIKALQEDRKFGFYTGYISIPEFFDINGADAPYVIPSWKMGFNVEILDVELTSDIWLDDPTIVSEFEYQYFTENYKSEEKIFADKFEELENFSSSGIELKFKMEQGSLKVYLGNERLTFLEELLNDSQNLLKKEEVARKLELKEYIEKGTELTIDRLQDYLDLVDWKSILTSIKFIWSDSTILRLIDCEVSWLDISRNCPLEVLLETSEAVRNNIDWTVITERCENDLILALVDKYDWDLDILISRLTIDEFREHFQKIIYFDNLELDRFYQELDEEFIVHNFELLPGITDFVISSRQDLLDSLLPKFKHLDWNWERFTSTVSIHFIQHNIKDVSEYADIDTVLLRFYKEGKIISDETLIFLLEHVSSNFTYLLNSDTRLQLSCNQMEILDLDNKIYWGNDNVNGFEVNANQDWTFEKVDRFKEKWSYPKAVEFISAQIHELESLNSTSIEWDLNAISSNVYLCNSFDFLKSNSQVLNWKETIGIISNEMFLALFGMIRLSEELSEEDMAIAASARFSLQETIEITQNYNSKFLLLLPHWRWRSVIERTTDNELLNFIFSTPHLFELFCQNQRFSKEISLRIPIDTILENEDMSWNWPVVTQKTIDSGLFTQELKEDFAHLWDWQTVLKGLYSPEQILLDNELPEIATFISLCVDPENVNRAWNYITSIYPAHLIWNAINLTVNIDFIKWDWDQLSSSARMPTSIASLQAYEEKINWEIFSGNNFLNKLFKNDKDLFNSKRSWENHVIQYLEKFKDKWHFDRLSKLNCINANARIIKQFRDEWSWDVLSSHESNLLTRRIKSEKHYDLEIIRLFFDSIDFEILSQRNDCLIDSDLLLTFSNAPWNWNCLSCNSSLKLNPEVFFEKLIHKDWDWFEISKNKGLSFNDELLLKLNNKNLDWAYFSSQEWLSTDTILKLKGKSWDWNTLSKNRSLTFNAELLGLMEGKTDVNWKSVLISDKLQIDSKSLKIISRKFERGSEFWRLITRNKNMNFDNLDFVDEFKEYWDWGHIIQEFKLDFNNSDILNRFSPRIAWRNLSEHPKFVPNSEILFEYKDQINWYSITPKLNFSNPDSLDEMIDEIGHYIDWTYVCEKSNFRGSFEFVKKYSSILDLNKLMNNSSIDSEIYNYIRKKVDGDAYSKFTFKLKQNESPWSGFVYHFTHLTNAIEIIRTRKILSRDRAEFESSKFSDAAGSVVHRKSEAHKFARFYFRPQTPTQFYNQCLGKDITDGRYYERAWKMGLPKCPVPVFFKFDIEEVFSIMNEKCYVSNGNMQGDRAKVGFIGEMTNKFNFEHIYGTITSSSFEDYKQWSQQEFLVKDFFDFSKLKKFEILVMTESDLYQLCRILENDPEILSKIRVAVPSDQLYINSNKTIEYSIKGNVLKVSTDYAGNGIAQGQFTLNVNQGKYRIRKGKALYTTNQSLTFYPDIEVEFEEEICFKLLFKDMATQKEPWEIINYCYVD